MYATRPRILFCFLSLMLSKTLVAQNGTRDSALKTDCSSCTSASELPYCIQPSPILSHQNNDNSNSSPASRLPVQDDEVSNPETPRTIESIMRHHSRTVILVSNLDANHVESNAVFQQIWRSSIEHWQQCNRIIWIAFTSRNRTPQEREELVAAGFDVIIEHGQQDLILFFRNPLINSDSVADLLPQSRFLLTERSITLPDLSMQLSRQLDDFRFTLRRRRLIRNNSERLFLRRRFDLDDLEEIAALESQYLGRFFRVNINQQARADEIEIEIEMNTPGIALQTALRVLALPKASFDIYNTRILGFNNNAQAPAVLCNLAPKPFSPYADSYDDEIDNGYMADDESDDL